MHGAHLGVAKFHEVSKKKANIFSQTSKPDKDISLANFSPLFKPQFCITGNGAHR